MGDDDADKGTPENPEIGIATKTRAKPKKPSQYRVLMLNDDYTPMEFVVMVLKRFFRMDMEGTPARLRGVRRLSLRSRRNEGEPGDGLREAEPAPAPVHARKGIAPGRTQNAQMTGPRFAARARRKRPINHSRDFPCP